MTFTILNFFPIAKRRSKTFFENVSKLYFDNFAADYWRSKRRSAYNTRLCVGGEMDAKQELVS